MNISVIKSGHIHLACNMHAQTQHTRTTHIEIASRYHRRLSSSLTVPLLPSPFARCFPLPDGGLIHNLYTTAAVCLPCSPPLASSPLPRRSARRGLAKCTSINLTSPNITVFPREDPLPRDRNLTTEYLIMKKSESAIKRYFPFKQVQILCCRVKSIRMSEREETERKNLRIT